MKNSNKSISNELNKSNSIVSILRMKWAYFTVIFVYCATILTYAVFERVSKKYPVEGDVVKADNEGNDGMLANSNLLTRSKN
jgi:hypothetical protein